MTKKEINRRKILEYLSDPANEFLPRYKIALDVLKYTQGDSIYRCFRPAELTEIENEAYEERKKRTVRERSDVLSALLREAKDGNVAAAKEYLDRVEGKVKAPVEAVGDLNFTLKWMDD